MKLSELKELDDKYILNSYKRYPLQIVKGQGVYVFDENNKKYLDFLGGIAVNALGYAHPKVLSAIKNQSENLIHVSNLFYTEPPVMLAKKLCKISYMDKVFFCNSGAEANELAIKLSRANASKLEKPKKINIVCMNKSFHGRTVATLAITKDDSYGSKFFPLINQPVYVELNNVEALNNAVNDNTAAIIIEPVQGEGGINIAGKDYLKLSRELADKHEALLIFDEVQCGLGRTGDYFAHTFSNVKPDIITVAKPLGAGMPIGAAMMTDKVASLISYGDHGSTFGANCIATTVALAFLEAIEEENLLENIKTVSKYLFEQLNDLKKQHPFIKEVRGKGFILGVELDKPASDMVMRLMAEGLISNCTADTVIRFLPPYIINKNHVDEAVHIINKVFSGK